MARLIVIIINTMLFKRIKKGGICPMMLRIFSLRNSMSRSLSFISFSFNIPVPVDFSPNYNKPLFFLSAFDDCLFPQPDLAQELLFDPRFGLYSNDALQPLPFFPYRKKISCRQSHAHCSHPKNLLLHLKK